MRAMGLTLLVLFGIAIGIGITYAALGPLVTQTTVAARESVEDGIEVRGIVTAFDEANKTLVVARSTLETGGDMTHIRIALYEGQNETSVENGVVRVHPVTSSIIGKRVRVVIKDQPGPLRATLISEPPTT